MQVQSILVHTEPIPTQLGSVLMLFQDTQPCFHCLCISCLPFSLNSHVIPSPDVLLMGSKSSGAPWNTPSKICQLCFTPSLSLKAVSQGAPLAPLEQLKVCFLKIECPDFTLLLTHVLQDCELHQCMITALIMLIDMLAPIMSLINSVGLGTGRSSKAPSLAGLSVLLFKENSY